MKAVRLPNGNLLVPCSAMEQNIQGDGMQEVAAGSEAYRRWLPYAVDDAETAEFYESLRKTAARPATTAA